MKTLSYSLLQMQACKIKDAVRYPAGAASTLSKSFRTIASAQKFCPSDHILRMNQRTPKQHPCPSLALVKVLKVRSKFVVKSKG